MECWASSLGGCARKVSREHLVTESFWTGDKVTVVGFPWCKTVPKEVGPAAIVSKVLCRSHNSLLSPVDQGGLDAFLCFRAVEELIHRRSQLPPQQWMRVGFTVDGPLLERWFIKTTINLLLVGRTPIRWALTDGGNEPAPLLVRAAYGQESLVKPAGLYVCASIGGQIKPIDGLTFMPIFDSRDYFAASLFDFRGYRFLLNLIESPLPAMLPELPGGAAVWGGSRPFYHLNRINGNVGAARSHFIDFTWPGSNFDHFAG